MQREKAMIVGGKAEVEKAGARKAIFIVKR